MSDGPSSHYRFAVIIGLCAALSVAPISIGTALVVGADSLASAVAEVAAARSSTSTVSFSFANAPRDSSFGFDPAPAGYALKEYRCASLSCYELKTNKRSKHGDRVPRRGV